MAVRGLLPGDHPGAHRGGDDGRSDPLLGLKENVILGKLIPAGTGLPRYRNVKVEPTEEAKAAMYADARLRRDRLPAFGVGSGQAVPLEEFDFGYR